MTKSIDIPISRGPYTYRLHTSNKRVRLVGTVRKTQKSGIIFELLREDNGNLVLVKDHYFHYNPKILVLNHTGSIRVRGIDVPPQVCTSLGIAIQALMDPDARELAFEATHNTTITLEDYNLWLSLVRVKDVRDTNPLVWAWLTMKAPQMLKIQLMKNQLPHPGEAVNMVRDDMFYHGFNPKYWRKISQTDKDLLKVLLSASDRRMSAIIMNAMGKYQIYQPNVHLLGGTLRLVSEVIKRNGKPNWYTKSQLENVIGIILRQDEIPDQSLTDYVSNQLQDEGSITATTYRGLLRGVQDWHNRRVHEQILDRIEVEKAENDGMIRKWKSYIPMKNIEISDDLAVTVMPLVTLIDLYREGMEMNHCVGSYGNQCISGQSRIFAILGDDNIRSTAELQMRDGKWSVVQLQGTSGYRRSVSPTSRKVANKIAEMYQEMWLLLPRKEHSATELIEDYTA